MHRSYATINTNVIILQALCYFQNEVNAIKWDPQGVFLASCSDDMTLKVWHTYDTLRH